jgi:hypothetical protein
MRWLPTAGLCTGLFVASLWALWACSTTTQKYVEEDGEEETDEKDGGFVTKPSPDSGLGILTFMPSQAYSGFDGEHAFKVPVAVYDSGDDLEVSATDSAAADIVPAQLENPERNDGTIDNGKYFLVTVKRPGTITLKATSGGKTVEGTITVTEYDASRWQVGKTRYENQGPNGDPPCTQCHVNGEAIDHSPAALATATDEKVAAVITTGISTAGFPIRVDHPSGHRWQVTESERNGLVTYLRSLEPRGFKK